MANPVTYANQFIGLVNQNIVVTQATLDYVYNNLMRGATIQDDNLYNRLTDCWLRAVRDRANWEVNQVRQDVARLEGDARVLQEQLAQGRRDVAEARVIQAENNTRLIEANRRIDQLKQDALFKDNLALVNKYSAELDRNFCIKVTATAVGAFSGILLGPAFFITFPLGVATAGAVGKEKCRRDQRLEAVEREVRSNHQLKTEDVRRKLIAAVNA